MSARGDSTPDGAGAPAGTGEWVSIFVGDEHPVMRLKRALDWEALTAGMVKYWRAAGKNVDGRPGLPGPVQLYVPLLVLMWGKAYHARQMEDYLRESAVARRFLDLPQPQMMRVRDHSNIARAEAALGREGRAAINALIIRTATAMGFTDSKLLSSDTTVQEPAIGYPNEPGILQGLAQRIARALKKLRRRGLKVAQEGLKTAEELSHSVKRYHLFARTKAEKQKVLHQLLQQSAKLVATTKAVSEQVSKRCGRVKQQAAATLQRMVAVARQLLPQIKYWRKTGKVAPEKILHAGIPTARAIVKGKGRVKFGMKWLIHRLKGGYLFGRRVAARADENQMPQESLKDYREVFGEKATPQMSVYDRGASLAVAAPTLQAAGVQKVGIPPRGQGQWLVGAKEQRVVKSERGKTEGSIGRLKSRKYGFSQRQERSLETQDAAGQRALASVNLNTLMRDLVAQAKAASRAQG
jgi:hypothetical protein